MEKVRVAMAEQCGKVATFTERTYFAQLSCGHDVSLKNTEPLGAYFCAECGALNAVGQFYGLQKRVFRGVGVCGHVTHRHPVV